MSETATEPKAKLRWYQYRLSHLFILMTLVAIGCGLYVWKVQKGRQQKQAVQAIHELRGWVEYDYEVDANGNYVYDAEPPGPAWFRNLVGVDFLADVVKVGFHTGDSSDGYVCDAAPKTQVIDAGLEHLKRLAKLKSLHLSYTRVSDTGMEHLKGLTNLEYLNLHGTEITDAGLEHLQGMSKLEWLLLHRTQVSDAGLEHLQGMTKLKWLWLYHTQVTDDGVKKLQQALPNCTIYLDDSDDPDHDRGEHEAVPTIWICPMHTLIEQTSPGFCPIDHMDLIPWTYSMDLIPWRDESDAEDETRSPRP